MTGLTELALRKRTVAIATVLLLVLGGAWAATSLRMELLPDIEPPLASVLVVYPGADPQSVLDQATIPVEGAIAGTRGLRDLNSTAESGVSVTIAQYEFGTNMKDVIATINQNLSGVQLPEGAQQPKVSDFDLNAFPILQISLTGDADVRELGDIAEKEIKPQLEAVDGVRSVEIVGRPAKQIVVLLDSEKMAGARIDVSQVSSVLQASNVLLPSGDIQENNQDVPIRAGYRITSTQQIRELVIRPAGVPQMAGPAGMGGSLAGGIPGGMQAGPTPGGSAPQPGSQTPPGAQSPTATSYQVQPGDTLWGIAERIYGDGSMSQAIFDANRGQISSPETLQAGANLTLPPAAQNRSLRPSSELESPAPTEAEAPGDALRIQDIATVAVVDAENSAISRTNGRPSLGLLIYRNPGANTVKVANGVKAALDDVLPRIGKVQTTIIQDDSTQIKGAIDDLTREAVLGALFAVVVIFLFLLSTRTTLAAAASIPLSMLITFILLNVTGMSLNIMTLGGMAVAVGRVVDDTVVVLENIYRHARRGEGILDAVRGGVGEVTSAITASTMTTVGVFIPLAFVGGIVGEVFRPFALTTTFALLASLLVALTAIPAIATFLSATSSKASNKDTWLQRLYTPLIRWALNRKRLVIAFAVFSLLASFASLPFIGTAFLPESSEKTLQVKVELPPGTGKDATAEVAGEVENAIAAVEGVEVYQTNIGNSGSLLSLTGLGAGSSSTADLYVRLSESSEVQETASRIREALSSLESSATVTVCTLDASGTGASTVEIVLNGSDYAAVRAAAGDVVKALKDVDGLTNLQSDVGSAKPEVSVTVDPEKAIQHGITAAQVALKVRQMIVGQVATTVSLDDKPVDVLVRVRPEDANSVEKLKRLAVGTMDAVSLSEIAEVKMAEGPVRLTRRDQKPAVTITGSIAKANTGAVNREVGQAIESMGLPIGVSAELGGVIAQQTEGFASLGLALVAAVALVYLIMIATMGSLLDPLVILVTLPLASIGALLSLLITGRTLGMAALIGMLMLIGIVVTNAIVLLDLVRRLRSQGLGIDEALVTAGRTRVRPILMTAGATILALFPLALGLSDGSIIATEMATVVIGGLTTSTALTLVVVPVMYRLADGLKGGNQEAMKDDGDRD
ncbi:MAG: efflux RND transporter permease subunit [Chloroflexi bacterium]|nr:efflux RND transporter permease subunit [Chloroflexota bacterium]